MSSGLASCPRACLPHTCCVPVSAGGKGRAQQGWQGVCQGLVAQAVAVRGADRRILSDAGAAFVPGAVSCCCGCSKVQEIP